MHEDDRHDGEVRAGEHTPYRREIRSFVRREGRMTDAQKRALDQLWAQYGIDAPTAPLDLVQLFGRDAPRIFEIGFGMGDYLLSRVVRSEERRVGTECVSACRS